MNMIPLPPRDAFAVQAAEGWLMLGNALEANEELEAVAPEFRYHPTVLAMRWQVYAAADWWEAAWVVSRALCEVVPDSPEVWICHANTLRKYKGLFDARQALNDVIARFPYDAVIRYNLACYSAQLGQLEEACAWLVKAFELKNTTPLKLAAVYDPDLKPLWDRIGSGGGVKGLEEHLQTAHVKE
jgi:predicted Zn-dependent protease